MGVRETLGDPTSRVVFGALVALTVTKLLVAAQLELTSLETYYWLYSRHPALSYFDHPGMIGWIIWLSTSLFGDSPLGVRLLPVLCGAAGTWLTWLAGRRLYGEGTGRLAAALVALAPMLYAYGAMATPDAPLLMWWSATIWTLANALSGRTPAWWLASGVCLGAAMGSKYYGIFLGLGTLIFLLASPEHRFWLRRKEPWLAALIALVVFSPTLWWNAQNDWQSLRYQGTNRLESDEGFKLRYIRQFSARQPYYMTPILCLWAWWAGLSVVARWRKRPWQDRLVASLGMPVLLFFLILTCQRSVKSYWTAPGYLAVMILVAASVNRGAVWGRRLHWGCVAILAIAAVGLPAAMALLPRDSLNTNAQLAAAVRRRAPDFVVGHDYHVAAQMAWHLRPVEGVNFTAFDHFDKSFPLWWKSGIHEGQSAVIVYEERDWPDQLDLAKRWFERVGEPERVEVTEFGGRRSVYLLLIGEGYRRPAVARVH